MEIDWNEACEMSMTFKDAFDILEHVPITCAVYWTAKAVIEHFIKYDVVEDESGFWELVERREFENAK